MSLGDADIDRLRAAYASLAEAAGPLESCPEPERLWSATRGHLPPEETRGLVDHTVACAACAEAWRLAREVGRAAPVEGRPLEVAAAAPSYRWWGGWGRLAAAAATVVVAVTAAVQWGPSSGLLYREGERATVRSLVSEERPLARSAFVLRWSPGPEGARYDVQVATEDLRVVARARGLDKPEYRVPEAALRPVPSGTRLLWQVECALPDGARAASITFLARLE